MRLIPLLLMCSCLRPVSLTTIPLASATLHTHDLSRAELHAVYQAANILAKELGCEQDIVHDGPTTTPGIHIHSDPMAIGAGFNRCSLPYVVATKNGRRAHINLCQQTINPATWPHAVRPRVYLLLNLMSRALGLPATTAKRATSSWSANDPGVRFAAKPLAFSFTQAERAVLRRHYCVRPARTD